MPSEKPATQPERQPDLEVRTFPFEIEDVRAAEGGSSKDFTIKGHAAVFNKWSHDLGGFRERIASDAFDGVLARDPHVVHVIDHDMSKVLSSTRSKTLELRADPAGLHMWSRVAPTSYAADLRVLMERGDVRESSFAFTVARDKWDITGEGDEERVERTILEVGELFDVTTTAMGAYPQTDSQVASRTRQKAREVAEQKTPGSLPDGTTRSAEHSLAAEGTETPPQGADSETSAAAGNGAGESLDALRRMTKTKVDLERAEYQRLLKEMTR